MTVTGGSALGKDEIDRMVREAEEAGTADSPDGDDVVDAEIVDENND
jgi:hypothetical protein